MPVQRRYWWTMAVLFSASMAFCLERKVDSCEAQAEYCAFNARGSSKGNRGLSWCSMFLLNAHPFLLCLPFDSRRACRGSGEASDARARR